MELTGLSFLGTRRGSRDEHLSRRSTLNPARPCLRTTTRQRLPNWMKPPSSRRTPSQCYSQASGKHKAAFLRRIADGFDRHKQDDLPSARILKPRCRCRVCSARWGALRTSCGCSPGWSKKVPGSRPALIRRSPIASRCPAPTFAPCCGRWVRWRSLEPATSHWPFQWPAAIPHRRLPRAAP